MSRVQTTILMATLVLSSASTLTSSLADVSSGASSVSETNQNNAKALAISQIEGYASTVLSTVASDALTPSATSNWKNLSFSLGVDDGKPIVDVMGVYGLSESKNYFLFNQTSIVQYDDRTTLNLGIGLRQINDAETVILGGNVFHDYEFSSGHRRIGLGVEALTSIAQFRANYYKALTDEIAYQDGQEQALDGYDAKLTYELPFFYSSNLSAKYSEWSDGSGYNTSSTEIGFGAEISPNLMVNLTGNSSDQSSDNYAASITYSIALGGPAQAPTVRDGHLRTKLQPIRHMLYQPVQRENRIMKKTTRLGVTASGY